MQNGKEPETSIIYLANGEQVSANVNGLSLEDGSGYVMVHGREIKVMPLQSPWSFAWSEVITIKRNDGSTFETELTPVQIRQKTATLDQGDETIYLLLDTGIWREMTEQERGQERRAWSTDMVDMQRIKQEWREYREG